MTSDMLSVQEVLSCPYVYNEYTLKIGTPFWIYMYIVHRTYDESIWNDTAEIFFPFLYFIKNVNRCIVHTCVHRANYT